MQHSSGSTDDPLPTPEEIVGQELRRLRLARGWSQEEVAQRMSAYGYDWHQTTVGRVETAQRPLRLNEAAAMAALFEVPLDSLMFASHYRLPEEIDAEIARLRTGYEVVKAERVKLRSRQQALEKDLEVVTERAGVLEAAMMLARNRIEGLEERYGRRS